MADIAYAQYRADLLAPYRTDREEIGHSSFAEWYLTGCLLLVMLEGVFTWAVSNYIGSSTYFFTQLTGYAIWPSEVFFLGLGLFIGMFIYLARGNIPANYGVLSYILVWLVHLFAAFRGLMNGIPLWHVDLRYEFLGAVVVPWVAVLGHYIRYDVVFSRLIKVAVPLALLNAARGVAFMSLGTEYGRGWKEVAMMEGIAYQADMVLLPACLAAVARSLLDRGKGALSIWILIAGIIAPLNKISIVACLFGIPVAMFLTMRAGRGRGVARPGRMMLAIMGTMFGLAMVGWGVLSFNEGAGKRFLLQRFFKIGVVGSKDVSTGRYEIWGRAVEQWKSEPIFGHGLGTRVYRSGTGRYLVYHSQYFRLLVQTGLLGVCVIGGAFTLWLWRALRTLKWEESGARLWPRIAAVSYALSIAFCSTYTEALSATSVSYTFWMLLAIEAAAHSRILREAAAAVPAEHRSHGGAYGVSHAG